MKEFQDYLDERIRRSKYQKNCLFFMSERLLNKKETGDKTDILIECLYL